jgi:DNA-binding transcriptional regulator LsrR (DeoR family)
MRSGLSEDRDGKVYQAAWLHHNRQLTRKAVAKIFDVDEATIARWFAEAAERGIISITVNPPEIKELEARLRQEFGLQRVRVIPSLPSLAGESGHHPGFAGDDVRPLRSEELGKAAAALIGPEIRGNSGIGLGGGMGVTAFARHLCHHCPSVGLKLFALSVSSREPFAVCSSSATAIATSLLMSEFRRRATRSRSKNPVPEVEGHALRLPDKSDDPSRMASAANTYYDDAMKQVELIVTGIGAIETCWVLNDAERNELRKMGAVGDILYDIYGEGGTPIKADPAAVVYPFSIPRLRAMVAEGKEVLVICAGKAEAIYHALTAKPAQIVTGLITDENTAREILTLYSVAEVSPPPRRTRASKGRRNAGTDS